MFKLNHIFSTQFYSLHLFDQYLSQKFSNCKIFLNGNIVDFVPCIGIPTVQNSNYSCSQGFISKLKLFILHYIRRGVFHCLLTRKLQNHGEKLIDYSLIFFSHQNHDRPKHPKCAITFDPSRHSKSSLSVTTGFISSQNPHRKFSALEE